jgi:hypothetical protein
MRKWLKLVVIAGLMLLLLTCNFPRPGATDAPTSTPEPNVTVIVATPTEAPTSSPLATPTPPDRTSPLATPTLAVTPSPTATATLTPTAAPSGLTATPTLAPRGDPLGFADPAWTLQEWHHVEGTGEWEGTIKMNVVGGVPPYRSQLENNPIVEGTEVPARWRLCKVMPATVRVWSADGQTAKTSIWIGELGCKP